MDYEDEETTEEKHWEVITTEDVEEDLDRFVEYPKTCYNVIEGGDSYESTNDLE